jgi:peptidyl-prolyl cis-trans isomerase D
MIQSFRKATQSFVIWIILGVLALAFGLSFGLPSDAISLGDEPLVKVDGDTISDADYQYEYMAVTQLMMPRSKMDPKFMELMGFKEEVLEAVIERELLADVADKMGMAATKADAEDLVLAGHMILLGETIDLLRGDKFNYDWFKRRFLPAFAVTEPKYLEYQQEELLARTVRDLITASTLVADSEIRAAYDKRSNQLSIRYARFPAGRYADLVDPTPEEIDRYLAEHKEELQKAYAAQGVRFTRLGKQVRLRFIQVSKPKPAPSIGDAEKDRLVAEKAALDLKLAKEKIDGAAKRLADGETMRAVARELSDDPATARRGGDYGWVSIEGTGSGLELIVDETAKDLEVGAPSAVVEGEEAFYIVQVDGTREGDVPEEEALRELAEEALMRSKGKDLARQAAKEALEAAKGGKSLDDIFRTEGALGAGGIEGLPLGELPPPSEAAAADDRPQLRVTGLFAKEKPIPGLGPQPELVAAAWEGDEKGELLDRLFEVGDDIVIAGVERRETGSDEGYEAVKDELYRELREMRAMRLQAYFVNRICREAKAHGDVSGNDLKLERLMVYDTKLGSDEDGKRVLRPYVVCDRVGNRGGMARIGAAMANPSSG